MDRGKQRLTKVGAVNSWESVLPKVKVQLLLTQSCPTLCDPMDCSLPGSSVHGMSQARILEWGAISFSRGSSRPKANNTSAIIPDSVFVLQSCHHLQEVLLNTDLILKTNGPKGILQKQSTQSVVDPPFIIHQEPPRLVSLF